MNAVKTDFSLFEIAFDASLSATVGYVPYGTAFLSHASDWELWESGVLTGQADNEEDADFLHQKYVDMYLR